MPLDPIPTDPEPTDAEIEEEKSRLRLQTTCPDSIARDMARFFCQARKREEEPDSFSAPFSSWVPELNYNRYLQSDLWHSIRKRVLENAGHKCAACFSQATQVHHRDYRPRVLAGRDDSPLVPLCKDCHHRIHNDANGKRRDSWQDEERVLAECVKRREDTLAAHGIG